MIPLGQIADKCGPYVIPEEIKPTQRIIDRVRETGKPHYYKRKGLWWCMFRAAGTGNPLRYQVAENFYERPMFRGW